MADSDAGAPAPKLADPSLPSTRAAAPFAARALTTGKAWLRANARDLVIVASLAALALMHRIATLEPVNTGGDAAIKSQFVREWFYRHDFAHVIWNHHMTRFGVLVPAYFAQRLLGHGIAGYYGAPLAACVVQVVFVYACGKRLLGRLAGVLSALLLINTSVMAIAGSQLLPDLFTGTYGIVMTYLYLRYAEAEGRARTRWLVSCALVGFLGYLAKETMFFFYPGMVIAVWAAARHSVNPDGARISPKRPYLELSIFFGVMLFGVLIETGAYRLFTQYTSRAAIVFASHVGPGSDGEERADTTFWKLFSRYEHVDKPWALAFHFFLPCWLGVLGFARNYRTRAVLALVASFFFMLTFLVRSLNPMLLWQRFMSRYLDPAAPFVELVMGLFLALVLERLWQERGSSRLWQWLARLTPYSAAFVFALSAALGFLSYSGLEGHNEIAHSTYLAAIADDTYRRDLPIVIRRARAGKQFYARDLQTLYSIYMDPRALVRDGRLPSFDEAKRVTSAFTYLVKDPERYSAAKINTLLDSGCVLEVRESASSMSVTPTSLLPPSCDALSAH